MKQQILHKFFRLIFSCLFIPVLCGCTHNNGDIGSLFGIWKVTEVKIDNGTDEEYEGTMFWSFQSSTIRMTYIRPYHDRDEVYGTWRLDDNTLFLDFPDEQYAPLPSSYLPRTSELQVLKMSDKKITLMYTEQNEGYRQIIYELKKW